MRKQILFSTAAVILALISGGKAAAQTYSNAVMSLNPVAYWPLAEPAVPVSAGLDVATNLGTALEAGNGYYETWWTNADSSQVLTNVNNVVHGAGGIVSDSDASMQCGGTGQYLVFPRSVNGAANSAVTLAPPFSVEMWVRINSTNTQREILVEGGNNVQMGSAFNNVLGQEGIEMGQNKRHFYWKTFDGPGVAANSLATKDILFPDTWHHLVITFDGTVKHFYVDGVASSSTLTKQNAIGQLYMPDYVSPMIIGNGNELSGGSTAVFDGNVDEFAIYTNVLDATTIANHYAAGTNAAPATTYVQTVLGDNPTVYLRLDEPDFTGPDLASLPVANNYGSLGAGANGFYLPGATPGATGPAYSGFGSASYAAALNGFNGVVDVGGGALPSLLNPTGNPPLTIVTWFRGNPADAGPRYQALVSHGTNSYRIGLDLVPGNFFDPGAGPSLGFTNANDLLGAGMDLNDGQWHQAVGVSDGTNDFFYLDGLLVKSGTSVAAIPGSLEDLILGGDPDFLGPQPGARAGYRGGLCYDGSLAQVAFFTNALTAEQVQQLFSAAGVPPVVRQQPSPTDLVLPAGTNVTFPTVVSGSSPISYQWYLTNGLAVSGQTNSSLVLSNVVVDESGGYYLVASNPYGAVTSVVVNLTVYGPPIVAEASPADIQVFAGSSPILHTTVLGAPPFAYQWSSNGVTLGDATNSSYAVSATQLGTATYIGMIGNAYGTAYVTNTVTVLPDPTAPYPSAVLADSPMAYFRLDETSGTTAYDYTGGNNATYTNVLLGQPGYSPSQEPGELAAEFGDFPPGNNYAGNVPSYLNFGTDTGNGEFSVEAWVNQYFFTGGGDGIVALGYGGADQFLLDTGATGSGYLRFVVRNAAGTSFAANSGVSIANDGLWHHVVGVCDEAGGHIYLYLDGAQIASATITAGSGILATSMPLSIGARESANFDPPNYDYQFVGEIDDVAIYDQALSATQVRNHYLASGAAPIITQLQPSSNENVNEGGNATFTVSVSGTTPLSFQWYDNNSSAISWGTNATLNLTNVQSSQAGTYSVVVANSYGSATTNASLTVNVGAPILIVDLEPTNVECYAGTARTFTVGVLGSEPLAYQWYLDGAEIGGATNASYPFEALAGTNAYWVTVGNSYGSTNSRVATVVGVAPVLVNPADYGSSLRITFGGYQPGEVLTNFPVLVRLSTNVAGFSYGQFASAGGADLAFTASSNAQALPYEIEQWDPEGESLVWVQVPLIASSNDYLTAYWGNPGQTDPAASNTNGAVWKAPFAEGSSYDLVWHLNQGGVPFSDSTGQDPATNGSGSSVAGVAGLGLGLDGTSNYLSAGALDLSNAFTLSVWINIAPTVGNIQTVWASKPGAGTANGFAVNVNNYNTTDGALRFITGNGSSTLAVTSAGGAVTFGQWHLVTVAVDPVGNRARLYLDGADVTLGSSAILSDFAKTNEVLLGKASDNFWWFGGGMDEARIRMGLSSAGWIWASWATVATNSDFARYGAVTTTTVGPVVLHYQLEGGTLVLDWAQGVLQSADAVEGPYADLPGATAPYPVPLTGPQKFYRVIIP